MLIHYRCCMSPTSAWNIWKDLNFCTDHRVASTFTWLRIFQEIWHFKDVEIIQMNILWMTTSKSYDFCLLNGASCVKSFWDKTILSIDTWLEPLFALKIKSPDVVEIRRGWFTTNYDHVLADKSCSVVSPRYRNHHIWLMIIVLIHEATEADSILILRVWNEGRNFNFPFNIIRFHERLDILVIE